MLAHWPLLSPKAFASYSAEEFREYIQSLYVAPVVKEKKPKPPPKLSWKRLKEGGFSFATRRTPKWITVEERALFKTQMDLNERELFLLFKEKKLVLVPDVEDGRKLEQEIKEIPW